MLTRRINLKLFQTESITHEATNSKISNAITLISSLYFLTKSDCDITCYFIVFCWFTLLLRHWKSLSYFRIIKNLQKLLANFNLKVKILFQNKYICSYALNISETLVISKVIGILHSIIAYHFLTFPMLEL